MDERRTYSRRVMMQGTGVNAAAFDVLSRNGLVKSLPAEGGNRQHRKFAGEEVVLFQIFARLHVWGASAKEVVDLAAPFRAALDWFQGRGLIGHEHLAELMLRARQAAKPDGLIHLDVPKTNLLLEGVRHNLRATDIKGWAPEWDDWVDFLGDVLNCSVAPQLREEIRTLPVDEYCKYILPYSVISISPTPIKYVGTLLWVKTEQGGWMFEYGDPEDHWIAYLTIDLLKIKRTVIGLYSL